MIGKKYERHCTSTQSWQGRGISRQTKCQLIGSPWRGLGGSRRYYPPTATKSFTSWVMQMETFHCSTLESGSDLHTGQSRSLGRPKRPRQTSQAFYLDIHRSLEGNILCPRYIEVPMVPLFTNMGFSLKPSDIFKKVVLVCIILITLVI